MGLSLLFPLGLAALGALLLPLLIHLARRQESRLTTFAALRWLRAQPKPRQRVRFDEWPLLLVRLLLLALIALWMAQLAWRAADERRAQVLVSPGLSPEARRTLALPEGTRAYWLSTGFPALDTPMPVTPQPVASLLREFDARLPAGTALTVIVPADWGAVDAQRPVLSRPVTWRVVAGHSPMSPARAPAPLRLAAVGIADAEPAMRTLKALQAAWQASAAPLPALSATAPDKTAFPPGTLVVWGARTAIPAAWREWIAAGGDLLLLPSAPVPDGLALQPAWRDARGDVLLGTAPFGRGHVWRLARALDPAAFPRLLEPGFPTELAAYLRPVPAPTRVAAETFAPLQQSRDWPRPPAGILPGLALLIALVFALERWMATSPRRGELA